MTRRSSTTRTVFVVVGSLAVLLGFGLGIGGGTLVWAQTTQRDSAGFYSTSAERLETPSFALKSDQIDLGVDAHSYRWVPGGGPAAVRLWVTSINDRPVFVGVGRSGDVESYLARAAHAEITDFEVGPFRPEVRESEGPTPPALPASKTFWAASASGTGTQTLTWPVQSGSWMVVVMNADGAAGVAVDVAVGAKTDVLLPIGLGLSGIAILTFAGGLALIIAGSTPGRAQPRPHADPTIREPPATWAGRTSTTDRSHEPRVGQHHGG